MSSRRKGEHKVHPYHTPIFVGAKLATMPEGAFYGQEVFAHQDTEISTKCTLERAYRLGTEFAQFYGQEEKREDIEHAKNITRSLDWF
jgi:hypothetical protein